MGYSSVFVWNYITGCDTVDSTAYIRVVPSVAGVLVQCVLCLSRLSV